MGSRTDGIDVPEVFGLQIIRENNSLNRFLLDDPVAQSDEKGKITMVSFHQNREEK